jgi:hypothetical protein
MTDMLNGCGMDCNNYSQTLIGWAGNGTAPAYIVFGSLGQEYGTNAVAARDLLINLRYWSIGGDAASGTDCSATASILENEISIELFPNPASDKFTITTSTPTSALINTANGATLSTVELNGETVVDVSNYAPGVYFIRTTEGQTLKFIKE